MNNNREKNKNSGGIYSKMNMSVKTANSIVCVLSAALLLFLLAIIITA